MYLSGFVLECFKSDGQDSFLFFLFFVLRHTKVDHFVQSSATGIRMCGHIKRYLLHSQLMPGVIMLIEPAGDALPEARLAGKYRRAQVRGPTSVPLQHFQPYYARWPAFPHPL